MAKAKDRKRRKSTQVAAFSATTGAALGYAAARYRNKVLAMLPHGFDSEAAGQGKAPTANKRVLLAGALTVWTCTSKNKNVKRWAPFAGFMLGAAIVQHRVTYEGQVMEELALTKELY